MSRRKAGRLAPLDHKQRLAKAVRNEKRKRVSTAVKWEKEHVRRGPATYIKRKSKMQLKREAAHAALVTALRQVPDVEEVKGDA